MGDRLLRGYLLIQNSSIMRDLEKELPGYCIYSCEMVARSASDILCNTVFLHHLSIITLLFAKDLNVSAVETKPLDPLASMPNLP